MKLHTSNPLLSSLMIISHSLTAHHSEKGNSILKRVFSLFLALALILGSVVVFASVKVSASEIIGYLYNGYDLPALPTDYDSAYVYSLIFTVDNNYHLIVSNKKATYSSTVGKYRCYHAKYCCYILEDGEWSLAASSSSGTSNYIFDPAFVPLWANYDLKDQNGEVWVVASEPVPIFSDIPNTPYLETSFDDQVVYIAEDETFNLFVNAENVNGTPSINWYAFRENEDGTWSNGEIQYTGGLEKYGDGCYIGGWEYIPDPDAAPYTIMFKAVVTNTVGDLTVSSETGFVILHVTSHDGTGGSTDPSGPGSGGTGDNSETLGKLEQLDTDIQEVQQAVADVSEKVDGLSDKVDQLPDEFKEGMGELMEQEKETSKNEGSDAADQVIDIIPNQSMDFLSALNKLIEVLRYEGIDATLTFPAIYIPAINGLFPRIQIMESQEIDFEYWVNQMPPNILSLMRALFDVAIVGYCLKELLSLIGSAVNGFGDGLGKQLAEE